MATYFDFEKKIPHVNKDDIYVKNGSIKDDKLVLEYSIGDLNPLSISLSALDKMTYIDNAEFADNKLILKYNRPTIANLSIELSSLDKHVDSILMSDDKNTLSLCFNDGTSITADTTKYAENFFLSTWSVSGKNLILKYNTLALDPIVIDLETIGNKIATMQIVDNTLSITDIFGNVATTDLEKFSYNDFIDEYELDAQNQLILKYATDKASGKAKDLSIDLARLARNYYIKKASLCGETLVLDYNTSDAGSNLSVDVTTLNNYIKSATIVDKTLVLTYNSDRFAPLSINVADFIKDYYIKDVKLSDDNKLYFEHNNNEIKIAPVDLSKFTKDTYIEKVKFEDNKLKLKYNDPALDYIQVNLSALDDHIDNITQNLENDTITFNRVNGTPFSAINLAKYANALSTMHLHGNTLVLKFEDGSSKHVSLDQFDKYIDSYDADDNNLSLIYNNNKGCVVLDKKRIAKNLSSTYIDNDILYFTFTNGSMPLTVDLKPYTKHVVAGKVIDNTIELSYNDGSAPIQIDAAKLNTYVDTAAIVDADLKLTYNANHSPTTVSLSKFNNELTNTYVTGSILTLEFANGKTRNIDLSQFHKHIKEVYLVGNTLKLVRNDDVILSVSLDKFDRYVSNAIVDNINKKIFYKYNDNTDAFNINIQDINYSLTSGIVTTDNKIVLSFANGKSDVIVDTSKLNSLTSGIIDDENNIVLKFANDKADVKIDASKLKTIDTYISSAILNKDDVLVFDYNTATPNALEVNLHKFARNDYINAGQYNAEAQKLILNYRNQDGFETKLQALSIDLPIQHSVDNYIESGSYDSEAEKLILNYNTTVEGTKLPSLSIDLPRGGGADTNYYVNGGRFDTNTKKLVLSYNTTELPNLNIGFDVLSNLNFTATDNQNVQNIADTIEQIVTAFGGNRKTNVMLAANDNQMLAANANTDLNYYVNGGRFDTDNKQLVLTYNTTALQDLRINYNVLSNMYFVATDEKSVLSIADAVQQIITAFGGNR